MVKQVIYIGNGNYLSGVPACDMTLAEWEALDESVRARALKLKLYQVESVKRAVGWDDDKQSIVNSPQSTDQKREKK